MVKIYNKLVRDKIPEIIEKDGEIPFTRILNEEEYKREFKKKTLAIDFDGVIHRYSKGWQDGSIYDTPMPGVKKALAILNKKFKIVIFSRRAAHQGIKDIKKWLEFHKIPYNRVTKIKPRARWYIDDKAIRFITWEKTLEELSYLEKNYPFRNRK